LHFNPEAADLQSSHYQYTSSDCGDFRASAYLRPRQLHQVLDSKLVEGPDTGAAAKPAAGLAVSTAAATGPEH